MPNPFYSANRTLERAKHHLRDLQSRIEAFTNNKQWTYVIERDINGGANRRKIKFDQAFFDEVPSIIFDAVNNLRATLDQAAYAASVASSNTPTKFAKFPFGEESGDVDTAIKGWCKEVPVEIQTIFRAVKPYKRGNPFLWHLNRLCNSKKHAILTPTTIDYLGLQVRIGGSILFLSHKWVPENYEIEILHSAGADFSKADGFAFRITLDDPESLVSGSEPLAILGAMGREVERVLMTTETECRRLWPKGFE